MYNTTSNPTEWVDLYGDFLFSYAFSKVRDRVIAQELVQECFLSALKSQESFLGTSSEKTWLTSILKHKIIDHIRGKYQGMNALTDSVDVTESLFDQTGHWKVPPQKWSTTPHEELEESELILQIEQCVDKLSDQHRELYSLRLENEVSTEECCNIFGVTATNLGVLLHRVRHQLRRCLEVNWFSVGGAK